MKNALDEINSRVDKIEDQISYLEDKVVGNTQWKYQQQQKIKNESF